MTIFVEIIGMFVCGMFNVYDIIQGDHYDYMIYLHIGAIVFGAIFLSCYLFIPLLQLIVRWVD